MANPLEIYQYAKKGVDEGRLRAINRLAGQTLTAPDSAQRDDYMRALNGVDPMAGYKVQQQLQQDAQATQDRQQKAAAGLASAWLSTANAPRAAATLLRHLYRPQSRAVGLQLPDQYDPVSLDQTAKAHLAMLQRGPSAQPYTLAPGRVGMTVITRWWPKRPYRKNRNTTRHGEGSSKWLPMARRYSLRFQGSSPSPTLPR